MSLNDPKMRQRRKVPLPRDAKRGIFRPAPFVSQGGEAPQQQSQPGADAVLADAVNEVLCQDIRKQLAKPRAQPLESITDLERRAHQILDNGPKSGRRRRSEISEGGRCLSSRSAPEVQEDSSFTESLVKRLNDAETRIKQLSAENKHKSALVQLEQSKFAALKHESNGKVDKKLVHKIEAENRGLKQQVRDMEQFLSDYGLTWVGDDSQPGPASPANIENEQEAQDSMWRPNTSVPSPEKSSPAPTLQTDPDLSSYPFKFAVLRKNAEDLSMLGGDGKSDIQQVGPGDYRLRRRDKMEMVFWKDGFQIDYAGLRPYTMKHNRAFVQDLLEGFFPFELKESFPDGVPLSVHDRTWEPFDGSRRHRPFSQAGQGQRLGDGGQRLGDGESQVPTVSGQNMCEAVRVTVDEVMAGECSKAKQQDHRTNFLEQLPKSVIRNGKIIPVRSEVADMIGQGATTSKAHSDVIVSDEHAVEQAKVATLKIKFGTESFLVKMAYTCSIQTLIDQVLSLSQVSVEDTSLYQLHTMYPKRTLDNLSMSLESENLIPKCALILERKAHED
eukprot:TRINITY_DN9011_c0_g1_i2.p1 TRINITY_DN9011_c0_g1~~TRINITY_DN9011_c0_g1_i2.p1  ORF type:complete len:558 (-),score=109.10 TRINITY_DN9011_c0_g1_i2:273-1946(-)